MNRRRTSAWDVIAYILIAAATFFLFYTPTLLGQVRYGMLGEQPYTLLVETYNPNDVKPSGFCIGRDIERKRSVADTRDAFVIVQSIVAARTTGVDTVWYTDSLGRDSTRHITESFLCPRGSANVHFHGFGNCNPSRTDYESLLEEGQEFGVIYCGVPRFFWREEAQAMLKPPLQVRHASTNASTNASVPRTSREQRRWLRAQLVAAAAGIAGITDPDHSLWTDPDPWTSRDKAEHFVAGGNIYALCRAGGAGQAESVGCGVLASVFWDVGQSVRTQRRFISLKDIAAGSTGAVSGWLVEKALERFRR